jgi:hypothetical protein
MHDLIGYWLPGRRLARGNAAIRASAAAIRASVEASPLSRRRADGSWAGPQSWAQNFPVQLQYPVLESLLPWIQAKPSPQSALVVQLIQSAVSG